MAFANALDQLPLPKSTPGERLREALALFEDGVEVQLFALITDRAFARGQDLKTKWAELRQRFLTP